MSDLSKLFSRRRRRRTGSDIKPPPTRHAVHLHHALKPNSDEIRLLRLLPAAWHDPISCDFQIVSLRAGVLFKTLSYVWGTDPPSCSIQLCGDQFGVRPNLFLALRRLRAHAKDEIALVWVDALCIDQAHIEERSHQVGLMGAIYSNCEEVCVWMGEHAGDWEEQMKCEYESCADFTRKTSEDGWEPDSVNGHLDDEGKPKWKLFTKSEAIVYVAWAISELSLGMHFGELRPLPECSWTGSFGAVESLLNYNSRYTRLWCVQEVVLPPITKVYFGPAVLSMDIILQAKAAYGVHTMQPCCKIRHNVPGNISWPSYFERSFHQFANLASFSRELHFGGKKLPIVETRLKLLDRSVTVDVDHIHALAGLTGCDPDYTITSERLFEDVSLDYITETGSLLPLSLSGVKSHCLISASWAIDWTSLDYSMGPIDNTFQIWLQIGSSFAASSLIKNETTRPVFQDRTLVVHGVLVDEIVAIGDPIGDYLDPSQPPLDWCRKLLHAIAPTDKYPADPQCTYTQAWFRTLCADSYWESLSAETMPPQRIGAANLNALLATDAENISKVFDPWPHMGVSRPKPEDGKTGIDKCMFIPRKRRVFLTRNGYLGNAFQNCKVGDQVVVAAGGNMPIVLRKREQSVGTENGMQVNEKHRVVSDCYLHGFMDGQQIKKLVHQGKLRFIMIT